MFPFTSHHSPIGVVVLDANGNPQYYPLSGVVDANGVTASLPSSGGGGGGGGATGSVTAAGTNGTFAQAVQGINGGVPIGVVGAFYQALQPVSVSNFPATQPVTLSGTPAVSVSNFPATQPVSGTVTANVTFPTTQAVSGTVAVSNFPATQPVSGSVSVSNFPASQPVTGTFFQSTQPVSTAYTTQQVGTWNYYAVAGGGTVTVGSGQRVIGIAAHSTAGGSFTINGGATVTVPANSSIEIQPIGNVTAPTIVFSSGIDAAFVETVM